MGKFRDLRGHKFGRLTVLDRASDYISPKGYHKVRWNCICYCCNTCTIGAAELLNGDTTSCGCYGLEQRAKRMRIHGQKGTPLYATWQGIKARCLNPNHKNYLLYGGRGITICDEWCNSFESFESWAKTNGYSQGLTIDRIDNDSGYSPNNCRIVDRKAQANHRRNNRLLTINGETHNIKWWADYAGIKYIKLYQRIRHGQSPEQAII